MLCTFFALTWFSVHNYLITKGFIPKWLQKIAHLIQILLFCFYLKQKPKIDIAKMTVDVSGAPEEKKIISCNKCEMCSKCEENQEKEKKKKQEKDKINEEISVINYLILVVILIALILLHSIVWILSIKQ